MRHPCENWARCRAGSPLSSASGSAMIADGETRATTSFNSAHVDVKHRLVRAPNAQRTRSAICDCGTRTATTPLLTLTRRSSTRIGRGDLASITRHVSSLNTGRFCSTARAWRASRHSMSRSQHTQPTATTRSSSDLSRLSCSGVRWSKPNLRPAARAPRASKVREARVSKVSMPVESFAALPRNPSFFLTDAGTGP